MWDFVVEAHERDLNFQDEDRWGMRKYILHDVKSASRMHKLRDYFQKNGYDGLIRVLSIMNEARQS